MTGPASVGQPPAQTVPRMLWAVPVALLLLALAPLPYGYYQLLRLITCGAALGIVYCELKARRTALATWAMAVVAIAYNPIFRIHFERETWGWINIVTALVFAVVGAMDLRRARA